MADPKYRLSVAEKMSHFRNLVVMALKDGKLAPAERDMLAFLANKWGLTNAQADEVLANPDGIKLTLPKSNEDKFVQLYDITEMMIIDGVVGAHEKALCIGLAKELGFEPEAIDILIEEILAGNRLFSADSQIQSVIKKRLNIK